MKKNVGNADRIIRIAVALAFAGLYFGNIVTGVKGLVFLALGAVFVVTSFISFCPLYRIFGLSTAKKS